MKQIIRVTKQGVSQLLTVLSLATVGLVQAQNIQTYNGEFPNGTTDKGDANYNYYIKNDERVKHGKFTYTQNTTTNYGYYTATITGNFVNGKKNGFWSHNITFKDVQTAGGSYSTGSIKLTNNYKNGLPHGLWNYAENYKIRNRRNLYEWTAYQAPITVSAKVNFCDGIFCGAFSLKNVNINFYKNLSGQLDKNGFSNGSWSGTDNSEEIALEHYKNIGTKYIVRELSSGSIKHKTSFNASDLELVKGYANATETLEYLKANDIVIDTADWVKSGFINLSSTLYNKKLLFEQIGGDDTYYRKDYELHDNRKGFYRIFAEKVKYTDLQKEERFLAANQSIEEGNYESAIGNLEYFVGSYYPENLKKSDLELIKSKISKCEEEISKKNALEANLKKQREDSIKNINEENARLAKIDRELESKKQEITNILIQYIKQSEDEVYGNKINTIRTYTNPFLLATGPESSFYDRKPAFQAFCNTTYNSLSDLLPDIFKNEHNKVQAESLLDNLLKIEAEVDRKNDLINSHVEAVNSLVLNILSIEKSFFKPSLIDPNAFKTIKKPLYVSFIEIKSDFTNELSRTKSFEEHKKMVDEMTSITDVVSKLVSINSKEVEKQLKKASDLNQKKQILLNQ